MPLWVNVVIVFIFLTNVRFCVSNVIEGPFRFVLQREITTYFLDKAGDKCMDPTKVPVETFNIGPTTYTKLAVCESGYVLPLLNENSLPQKWEDGNTFDNPHADIIAVALLDNTLRDNWFDYECFRNRAENTYDQEQVCDAINAATIDSPGYYYFLPSYGPNALRSTSVYNWRDGIENKVYYNVLTFGDLSTYGASIREYTFSQTPGENFASNFVNNVVARELISSEYADVTSIADGLSVDWATCVSWYKVSQPPEIVDKQNSFQFVLACGQRAMIATCVAIFDYFELMYIENNGIYLRAGINGPSIGKRQLS